MSTHPQTVSRSPGRPTALTPEVADVIIDFIAKGNYASVACQAAGVSEASLIEWKHRAEKGEEYYSNFLERLERAQAQALAERVARIRKAGESGNWLPDAWHLERSRPDLYGRRDRLDVESHSTIDIQVNVSFGSLPQAANVQVEAIGTEVKELPPAESSTPPTNNDTSDVVEASTPK